MPFTRTTLTLFEANLTYTQPLLSKQVIFINIAKSWAQFHWLIYGRVYLF